MWDWNQLTENICPLCQDKNFTNFQDKLQKQKGFTCRFCGEAVSDFSHICDKKIKNQGAWGQKPSYYKKHEKR